jgi:5-formyltetrahydrofolate cyclo-ligase
MNLNLIKLKSALRKAMLAERDSLDATVKGKMDEKLTQEMIALIKLHRATTIHSYIPMGSEINLIPLLKYLLDAGITVVTPRSLPKRKLQHLILNSLDELEKGIYGTSHPANSLEFKGHYDMILVPGLAFDKAGYRLGYGAGYYDTFLVDHPDSIKVGICYPFQVVDQVPAEPHDIKLDLIIY